MNIVRTTLALTLLLFVAITGCGDPTVLSTPAQSSSTNRSGDELFNFAVENLNRLPEFPPAMGDKADAPRHILTQIIERLNQWVIGERPQVKWQADPLIATLPGEIQQRGLLKRLGEPHYDSDDGYFLREAVWLRDVANLVRAGAAHEPKKGLPSYGLKGPADPNDPRHQAARLFDWTVRNVELEADAPPRERPPLRPWEVLLLGRGTAMERAWVFMLLARQQRLDVVMLYTHDPKNPENWVFWLPALLHDGQLYLFDSRLGLPVPGPQGEGIATLEQAAADPAVLKQLDVEKQPYAMKPADLKEVVALIEADSRYLSRRMALVQSRLTGNRKVVLTTVPTPLADRLMKCKHVAAARIWVWPYEMAMMRTIGGTPGTPALKRQFTPLLLGNQQRRIVQGDEADNQQAGGEGVKIQKRTVYPLWTGRLRHLQGLFDADGRRTTSPTANATGREEIDADETAKRQYLDAREMASAPPADLPPQLVTALDDTRQAATYWLGLVSFEQGNYTVAKDFFERTLQAGPDSPWTPGATYNLGRTLEAMGDAKGAIALYESPKVEMPTGSRLRAEWLKKLPDQQ